MLAVYYLLSAGVLLSDVKCGVVLAAEKSGSRAAALHNESQWSLGVGDQVTPPSAV